MASETRYNVYIVREADDVAVSLIWTNMRGEAADRRSETGLERINTQEYWTEAEKVWSEKDAKYAKDIEEAKKNRTWM